MSRHVDRGPASGYSFNRGQARQQQQQPQQRQQPPRRGQQRERQQSPPPPPPPTEGGGPSREAAHHIFHDTGLHRERESSPATPRRSSLAVFTRPSKLEAMAFAVEHSPRDWIRFEDENDRMAEIDELKNKLAGQGEFLGKPPLVGKAKRDTKQSLHLLLRLHKKNKYNGPSELSNEDYQIVKKLDRQEYGGKFSHAYEVPMYRCCGTPLGRHCPNLVWTCQPNACVGKYGCQLDFCNLCCDPCGEETSSSFVRRIELCVFFSCTTEDFHIHLMCVFQSLMCPSLCFSCFLFLSLSLSFSFSFFLFLQKKKM